MNIILVEWLCLITVIKDQTNNFSLSCYCPGPRNQGPHKGDSELLIRSDLILSQGPKRGLVEIMVVASIFCIIYG